MRERVEEARFLRPELAMVRWAGSVREVRSQEHPGFQVDRARFDALLLDAASEAGARVLQSARVESIDPGWQLRARTLRGSLLIVAEYLVDASGRVCLSGGKRVMQSAPLLALWAYWRCPRKFGPETRVESGEAEWFWGAPLPDGSFNATVLMDPKRYRESGRQALYELVLAKSKLMCDCLSEERLTEVAVCDATPFCVEEMISRQAVKIGEAAFALDPLSSQGVHTAMGSALHAATAIHTMANRPDSSEVAMRFYAARQREAVATHREAWEGFYHDAAAHHGSEFWTRRAGTERAATESGGPPESLPPPDLMLDTPAGVELCVVPCQCGDYVVEMRGIKHGSLRRPLVFLEDVAVADLWERVTWPARAGDVVRAWSDKVGAERALRILGLLWQSRLFR